VAVYLWIGLGGFLGANARYLVQSWATRVWGPQFPVGTLIANVSGSFLLTLFGTLVAERFNVRDEVRLFIATGFLGGYTTFSSFAYETWLLNELSGWGQALLNIGGNIFLGAIGVLLGLTLARLIIP